jgi:hypothetical protein
VKSLILIDCCHYNFHSFTAEFLGVLIMQRSYKILYSRSKYLMRCFRSNLESQHAETLSNETHFTIRILG